MYIAYLIFGGGAADGPSLLGALSSMGADPRSSSLQQVLALLSFVCPSLSARATELGWTQDQLIAEMQITNAPAAYVHATSSMNSSGLVDGPPASYSTPTSSSSTPLPIMATSSPDADQQLSIKGSRNGESAASAAKISGQTQPQVSSTHAPTFQSNNPSPFPPLTRTLLTSPPSPSTTLLYVKQRRRPGFKNPVLCYFFQLVLPDFMLL